MHVREKIAVTFEDQARGIYRLIPTHLDNGKGALRKLSLSQIRVTDEAGRKQTARVQRQGRAVNIRIGDADVFLPAGTRKIYVIEYVAKGMLNWFDQEAQWEPSVELYWNSTGHEWPSVIATTSVKVEFPQVDHPDQLRAQLFMGPYGDREGLLQEGLGWKENPERTVRLEVRNGLFVAQRITPLQPGEGLTFVLGMPETAIPEPTGWEKAMAFLGANVALMLPLGTLFVLWLVWLKIGRDQALGPIAVRYDPPEGLSGPEAGALIDQRVDPRDFSAGLISLAVKGYLTIQPQERGMLFKRRGADVALTEKQNGDDLSLFESKLLRRLRAGGTMLDEEDLRECVAPYKSELQQALFNSLVSRGYYRSTPSSVRTQVGLIGGIGIALALYLIARLVPASTTPVLVVSGVASLVILWLFARIMPRRTGEGVAALRAVKGFEEFMQRARRQELEWLAQKHPDQSLFEQYLPHAVAFGLVAEWARAFEGILTAMPTWYDAPHGTGFHARYFGNDLMSVTKSIGAATWTPPRSSGASGGNSGFGGGFGGGGGFSGGGFGGGGGGSW